VSFAVQRNFVTDLAGAAAQAGRREERKAQNRAKLLAAARRVFAEKGFGEATARDIVRETDLATGTFYNYFRDKDEVFRALLEEFEQRVTEAVAPGRANPTGNLEERIERGAQAFFQVVAEDAELFHVLRRNAGLIAILPTEAMFEDAMADFAADLENWRREGILPGVDLEYLSAAIAGGTFQIAIQMVERDPPDPQGAARFLTRALVGAIQGLVSEDGAKPAR
jgi:AcrR family transcriptional regulator